VYILQFVLPFSYDELEANLSGFKLLQNTCKDAIVNQTQICMYGKSVLSRLPETPVLS